MPLHRQSRAVPQAIADQVVTIRVDVVGGSATAKVPSILIPGNVSSNKRYITYPSG